MSVGDLDEPRLDEAVVLVGGKGNRLRSVVSDRPKPMALVWERPFLEWLLLALRMQQIKRVVLCTGHLGHLVQAHFGDGSLLDMELVYSSESMPLGTAGAVRGALDQVRAQRFLVLNGDSLCRVELRRLVQAHVERCALATMWLVAVDDCRQYGAVDIGPDHAVRGFAEKSPTVCAGLINAGIYLIERSAMESIPPGRAMSLETEVFPGWVGRGLYGVTGGGPFLDIGTPEAYAAAGEFLIRLGLVAATRPGALQGEGMVTG